MPKTYATDYTIPKIKRELKQFNQRIIIVIDYTIPKIKRELKHIGEQPIYQSDYTIPKIKRELKPGYVADGDGV